MSSSYTYSLGLFHRGICHFFHSLLDPIVCLCHYDSYIFFDVTTFVVPVIESNHNLTPCPSTARICAFELLSSSFWYYKVLRFFFFLVFSLLFSDRQQLEHSRPVRDSILSKTCARLLLARVMSICHKLKSFWKSEPQLRKCPPPDCFAGHFLDRWLTWRAYFTVSCATPGAGDPGC